MVSNLKPWVLCDLQHPKMDCGIFMARKSDVAYLARFSGIREGMDRAVIGAKIRSGSSIRITS